MNIKKVIRNTSILFAPFILIILIIISFLILKKDFQNSHLPYAFGRDKLNISAYYVEVYFQKIQNFFNISNKKELKKIEFSISEQGLSKLIANVPESTRTYVRGNFLQDRSEAKRIRFRYKGSNPYNWLFEQKEIRVKTRKKDLINRQRYFDYRISQSEILNDYAYFKLASLINQLSYDVELVDVVINNEDKGIHLQREILNEGFLRRKKIMPINAYRGEQKRYDDRNMSLNNNLFFNKALWEKISVMNTIPENDFSDLENFLKMIENLSLTNSDFESFIENNLEHFADVAAFQIITQFVVFDNFHNIRIALDPWSGKKFLIIHDGAFRENSLLGINNFDKFIYENQLFSSLSKNPVFLNSVYDSLNKILNKEKYLDKVIEDLYSIEEEYKNSFKKDIGRIQRKYFAYIKNENEDYFNYFINFLLERKNKINEILFKNPQSSWHSEGNMFFLKINDKMPLTNLEIEFNNKTPESIIFDVNNNEKIDSEDLYFFSDKNGKVTIKGKFFSNRIKLAQSNILEITNNNEVKDKIENTKFGFFLDENFKIKNIHALNIYSKTKFLIKKEINKSYYPYAFNNPLLDKKNKKISLKGVINVEKNMVYNDEVFIEKGTNFTLCRTCSLIFKNKVIANGDLDNPIVFRGKNNDYWGTLALFGKQTKGSKLEGVIIKNATGDIVNNINFFSALSIHLTENIKINNLVIEANNFYDDMLHIIYSKNITVKDAKFYNSYADAIDIDISDNIKLQNINILNAKNDGIDFMESDAEIENAVIIGSGDKAISVGENSNLEISNSKLFKNKYGLVAKDNSIVNLKKTQLMENEIQLAVYKKNWRYGKSGKILAKENIFNKKKNNIINKDKEGKIIFLDDMQNKSLKIIEVDELEFN